jgi:hypothetical protein
MEKAVKTPNYTPEMVETAIVMYQELGNEGLDQIADAVGRSVKSVRAKLVREGVYVKAEPKAPAFKDEGPSKKDLLSALEAAGFSAEGMQGATKAAIERVIDAVKAA